MKPFFEQIIQETEELVEKGYLKSSHENFVYLQREIRHGICDVKWEEFEEVIDRLLNSKFFTKILYQENNRIYLLLTHLNHQYTCEISERGKFWDITFDVYPYDPED